MAVHAKEFACDKSGTLRLASPPPLWGALCACAAAANIKRALAAALARKNAALAAPAIRLRSDETRASPLLIKILLCTHIGDVFICWKSKVSRKRS